MCKIKIIISRNFQHTTHFPDQRYIQCTCVWELTQSNTRLEKEKELRFVIKEINILLKSKDHERHTVYHIFLRVVGRDMGYPYSESWLLDPETFCHCVGLWNIYHQPFSDRFPLFLVPRIASLSYEDSQTKRKRYTWNSLYFCFLLFFRSETGPSLLFSFLVTRSKRENASCTATSVSVCMFVKYDIQREYNFIGVLSNT